MQLNYLILLDVSKLGTVRFRSDMVTKEPRRGKPNPNVLLFEYMLESIKVSRAFAINNIVACQGSGVSSKATIHRADWTNQPFNPLKA